MKIKINKSLIDKINNLTRGPAFVVIILIFIHAFLIIVPPVNLEYAFVDAAKYFATQNENYLHQYFSVQANTLTLSYLAYLFSMLAFGVDELIIIRILNLVGLVFLAYGLDKICSFYNLTNKKFIFLLIFLNPLVWIYSGRATADFLPIGLGIYSLSLALGEEKVYQKSIIGGLFLGLSVLIKPHALLFILFLFVMMLMEKNKSQAIKKFLLLSLSSILIFFVYLIIIKHNFGFLLTPHKFQQALRLNFSNIGINFILYVGFLGILSAPGFFVSSHFYKSLTDHYLLITMLLILMISFGLLFAKDVGELNFGPVDNLLNEQLRLLTLSLMSIVTLLLTYLSLGPHSKISYSFWASILIVIFLFSLTRPAQRYLIFLVPFFIMALPKIFIESKKLIWSTVAIFIAINCYIELNRWSNGTASLLIVHELERNNLIEKTNPGAVGANVNNFFFNSRDHLKEYIVISGISNKSIITVTSGVGFFKKTYSVESIN
jgi:hypothetical protein